MIEKAFNEVYTKFKLKFYQSMFQKVQDREMTLTAVETFSIEIIHSMDKPTVSEFAAFVGISLPNATYKVNSLMNKGYLKKIQSKDDKREYHLEVTDKYMQYYNMSSSYINTVLKRVEEQFADETVVLQKVLSAMSNELMPELDGLQRVKY